MLGTYTVTVTDANACTATNTITLVDPQPLDATVSFTNPTCNGFTDGTITISAVAGTGTIGLNGYEYALVEQGSVFSAIHSQT